MTKLSFFESNRRLPTGFIFKQDGAPAYTTRSARNGLGPTVQISPQRTNDLQICRI